MKNLLKLLSAVAILVSLVACGGGGSSSSSAPVYDVTALAIKDNVVGGGNTAAAGKTLTVNYVAYLYDPNALDTKGKFIDSSTAHGTTFSFVLGAGSVIAGWDQGLVGMKVGGSRTLTVPSSLAYGVSGQDTVPGKSAMVFDISLVSVQ